MKYKAITFWLSVFVLLFVFLQTGCEFHFYYIEQNQLFQQTLPYIIEKGMYPGGMTLVLSEYLVQFFLTPYMGALITALLLLCIGILTHALIHSIAPHTHFVGLCLLPVISLLVIQFDFNYLLHGTVSYLLMMLVLVGLIRLTNFTIRFVASMVAMLLIYYLAGSVCMLLGVAITLIACINRSDRCYLSLLLVAEGILIGMGTLYYAIQGEYRFIFLPDSYYHNNLTPGFSLYFSWIALLLVVVIASAFRKRETKQPKRQLLEYGIQSLLVIALCWWGIPRYMDTKSAKLKELDYYCRTEQWDAILERCQGTQNNYLYLCYINMALANKGMLAEKMFAYDQRGVQGISVTWNKSASISTLLSDLFFAMNNVAASQEMAFEAYVCSTGEGNPRMLKRLVQTNLIYGYYPVAEKYITILENTYAYKEWAKAHRTFVHDDAAIAQDPLLGVKRRSLFQTTALSMIDGIEVELKRIAEQNPSDRSPIEYLGAIYLLSKDIPSFQGLIDTYYGTPVLPQLPVSFQEALIIAWEKEPQKWAQYALSESIVNRFYAFKKQIIANKSNSSALPNLMRHAHGDTYWFYFMFK